jgi:hypothetical protein
MEFAAPRIGFPSLRTTLVLDAAFEFLAGAVLVLAAHTMGDWLGIGWIASVVVGAIFVAAGVAIVQMLRAASPDLPLVRALAIANIVGGTAGWIVLIVGWPWIQQEGRWTLGMVADLFIVLGLLELRALQEVKLTQARQSPGT